jgi:hypothetical protein
MLVNGYVISKSFVFGWIKLTPFLLIAINNCSGNVGSDVCLTSKNAEPNVAHW